MNEIATLDRPSSELVAEWPGYVVAFQNALTAAQDGLATAAGIYVAAIDEDPERAKEFRAALPTFSETVWSSFEKIGRKQVDPRVLFGDGGPHRARIKQLPYTTQKRLLDGEPVELLVSEGDVLKVDARSVTSDQAAQLFAGDHVRSTAEQKTWVLDREKKARLTKGDSTETMPYVISGNRVTFKKNLTMTVRELKDLLQVMAG